MSHFKQEKLGVGTHSTPQHKPSGREMPVRCC
jgi:hypothetical protein